MNSLLGGHSQTTTTFPLSQGPSMNSHLVPAAGSVTGKSVWWRDFVKSFLPHQEPSRIQIRTEAID